MTILVATVFESRRGSSSAAVFAKREEESESDLRELPKWKRTERAEEVGWVRYLTDPGSRS